MRKALIAVALVTNTIWATSSEEEASAEPPSHPQMPATPSASAPPHETVRKLERAPVQPEDARLPVFAGYDQPWHQAHDALIVRVVEEFNASHGWGPDHESRLDPALVKAWALQESGGHEAIFTSGDMMQMNNAGDWAPEKEWFGVRRGQRLTPEESLRAALQWAYYKGEETRPMRGDAPSEGWYPTVRGGEVLEGYESRFTHWRRALTRYNGGGVADYHGDIMRRMRHAS